jgi:hypothetical protein
VARPSLRVDRTSLSATAGLDGWPPAATVPQGVAVTEPGVQADSSAPPRLTIGGALSGPCSAAKGMPGVWEDDPVVGFLLSVTFACGLVIAVSHVINQRFIAPVYDVVANLTAFGCAVAASALLGHWVPATLSAVAFLCWLVLARRTFVARTAPDVGVAELATSRTPDA